MMINFTYHIGKILNWLGTSRLFFISYLTLIDCFTAAVFLRESPGGSGVELIRHSRPGRRRCRNYALNSWEILSHLEWHSQLFTMQCGMCLLLSAVHHAVRHVFITLSCLPCSVTCVYYSQLFTMQCGMCLLLSAVHHAVWHVFITLSCSPCSVACVYYSQLFTMQCGMCLLLSAVHHAVWHVFITLSCSTCSVACVYYSQLFTMKCGMCLLLLVCTFMSIN